MQAEAVVGFIEFDKNIQECLAFNLGEVGVLRVVDQAGDRFVFSVAV
ncbi:hypothetical protein [Hahella chejuensis]|nr:hypothetical protein [Hahella chejuensis]